MNMPSVPYCSRSLRVGMMRHGQFLLALLVVAIHVQVRAECQNHGCVLTALDIHYDESTQGALSILRQTQTEITTDDAAGLREKALSTLLPAGDESKTTLTLCGYKGGKVEDQINQDRAIVVSPFKIVSDSSTATPLAQLLGVFDGHGRGGELTSQYAINTIPSLLAAKLASIADQEEKDSFSDSKVVEALKQTFDEVDKNDPSFGSAGCTATVILRLGQKLFVANAGDRCVKRLIGPASGMIDFDNLV